MDQMRLLEFGESNLQNYMMKAFTHIDSKVSAKAVEILFFKECVNRVFSASESIGFYLRQSGIPIQSTRSGRYRLRGYKYLLPTILPSLCSTARIRQSTSNYEAP